MECRTLPTSSCKIILSDDTKKRAQRISTHARAVAVSRMSTRSRVTPKSTVGSSRVKGTKRIVRVAAGDLETPPEEPLVMARDDDVLPDNLLDSVVQAGEATAAALKAGKGRCVAELLIPELWDVTSGPVMAEEGDQLRWWELAREFVSQLGQSYGAGGVRAVFPDAGGAAMLKNRWGNGVNFAISSLDDAEPMQEADSLIVITCPDPPSLKATRALAEKAMEKGVPVVMFNPRLASGDVGIGVAVRDMRVNFLSTFLVTYSIYPLSSPSGSVFKKYPGQWQVFLEEENNVGRYKLVAERSARPAGEDLDDIIMGLTGDNPNEDGEDGEPREKTLIEQVGGAVVSMQRFMRALTQ
mmetsp:Transcript_49175/g.93915  ORF Transcript_49175/g.93915 Transcript_49175/m.93915 type:complete len:355 (-) Transcript_49175:422-1486(-)